MIQQPLPTLAAWVEAFANADIPILPESASEIALLREVEEARGDMDAHTLAENLENDPLTTLKVLVHVSRYCTSLSIDPPETLVGALVMLGVGPFFAAFAQPLDVETCLSHRPEALEGLHQVVRRSRRAAHFATAFAEMLLWCHAPVLILEITRRLKADHTLRSAAVQQDVLGIHIDDLAQELMRRWQLPDLLIHCSDQRLVNDPKVRTVTLGVRIARHTQHGWDDPHCLAALPDDASDVGLLLNIAPEAAHRLIRGLDG